MADHYTQSSREHHMCTHRNGVPASGLPNCPFPPKSSSLFRTPTASPNGFSFTSRSCQEGAALIGFDINLTTNLAPHFLARSNIPPRLSPRHPDGAVRVQTSGKHLRRTSDSINFTFRSRQKTEEVGGRRDRRGGRFQEGGMGSRGRCHFQLRCARWGGEGGSAAQLCFHGSHLFNRGTFPLV